VQLHRYITIHISKAFVPCYYSSSTCCGPNWSSVTCGNLYCNAVLSKTCPLPLHTNRCVATKGNTNSKQHLPVTRAAIVSLLVWPRWGCHCYSAYMQAPRTAMEREYNVTSQPSLRSLFRNCLLLQFVISVYEEKKIRAGNIQTVCQWLPLANTFY
jgi:hypothetical protein